MPLATGVPTGPLAVILSCECLLPSDVANAARVCREWRDTIGGDAAVAGPSKFSLFTSKSASSRDNIGSTNSEACI